MKNSKVSTSILAASLLTLLVASDALSWCWKRDTGNIADNCGVLGFQTACCDGNLEKWVPEVPGDVTVSYRISTSTDAARKADLVTGFSKWNGVEMSTFRYARALPDTSTWNLGQDGTNLVNLDKTFCTHYPEFCGGGVLGLSLTISRGIGATYRAVESDILLNGEEFAWGPEGSTDKIMDTVAVVAHEAGHNAGLSHPGDICNSYGSAGCGAEAFASTMYWNFGGGQPTDKSSLELDDVAGIVYGYPRATFRVKVIDQNDAPVKDAAVTVNGTAMPLSLDALLAGKPGGYVIGDVHGSNTLFGDRADSLTYLGDTPHFAPTAVSGFTTWATPVHRNFYVRAAKDLAASTLQVMLADGQNEITIRLNTAATEDLASPLLGITSHTDGETVTTSPVIIAGAATDMGRGASGIAQVKVNGVRALNDVAVGDAAANWSLSIGLSEGPNRIDVIAKDDSATASWDSFLQKTVFGNSTQKTILLNLDTTGPLVAEKSPAAGLADPELLPSFSVRFNEALKATTVSPATVFVPNLAGTVSYGAADHVVTFTPAGKLAFGTTYNLTITTGLTDEAGNALKKEFVFPVSTRAAAPAPKPVVLTDGSGSGGAPNAGQSGVGCFIETLLIDR